MKQEEDLQHLSILITRPSPQANSLCHLIQEHGGNVVHFPTIAFGPPPDDQAFQQGIAALGDQDWVIFNSPQAVFASLFAIRKAWPILPSKVNLAAIGEGTAKVLHEAGYQALFPETDWSSEGLLALSTFQAVNDKKIAVIRGAGGREWLDKILMERGAQVLPVLAYERQLPQASTAQLQELLIANKIDIIVCASFDAMKNLKILLGEMNWPLLKKCAFVVVSERIKKLAQDLGFQTICVARNASDAAILEALVIIRKNIKHDRTKNR